jgi:hypothetical protein
LHAGYFGVAENEVPNVLGPYASVRFDVILLRSLLLETMKVWGLVRETATGKGREVCRAPTTDS